jgi:hypothetical protein
LKLGNEHLVYDCGVKEAQQRLALDENLKRTVAEQPGAGTRPQPRPRVLRQTIGGTDHLSGTLFNEPTPVYQSSLIQAQQQSAFDPQARAAADIMLTAGGRVQERELGQGKPSPGRTTKSTFEFSWPKQEQVNNRPQTARSERSLIATIALPTEAASPVKEHKPRFQGQPVGGKSSLFVLQEDCKPQLPLSPGTNDVRSRLSKVQPVGGRGILPATAGLDFLGSVSPRKQRPATAPARRDQVSQIAFG